jgi:hypothetical protein
MMTIKQLQVLTLSWALLALAPAAISATDANTLDAKTIGQAAGTAASVTDDDVIRIGWSRTDVPVKIDGLEFPPAAGLGSWAAFKAMPAGGVMVMGDTVVFEDEITPAMDAAFAHGLEVTALHNHFVFDRPPAFFMHIGGHADSAEELAEGVKAMWDAIKAVRAERAMPAERFAGEAPQVTGNYDTAVLEKILGGKGSLNGQVLKFTFERKATMGDVPIGASMGLSTWAAFSGNAKQAVVDGDFAMTADEVQPVMHALRDAGIHIVALHNHMIGEVPPYYFLHYWGKGKPETLAEGIRAALDAQQ